MLGAQISRRIGLTYGALKCHLKCVFSLWRLAPKSMPTADARHQSRCVIAEGNMARCVWALQQEELTEFVSKAQQDARSFLHEAIKSLKA
jgi:hypothetical protein